ncbi:hypothetical protein XELAEV_18030117mg [Xenopus laevis]|uniref:Uncharacterized protein n=1 Tax=Xenopus laevis TaxID=8355 RepID=A0A974HIP1_XENLA|nr:hypothetical protein XELAEV_18030117mg [Xenopus laevis]
MIQFLLLRALGAANNMNNRSERKWSSTGLQIQELAKSSDPGSSGSAPQRSWKLHYRTFLNNRCIHVTIAELCIYCIDVLSI